MPARTATRPKSKTATQTGAVSKRGREPAAVRRSLPARLIGPETGLPSWSELESQEKGSAGQANKRENARAATRRHSRMKMLDVAPSIKIAMWTLIACIAVTLFVGHVYATQATLAELQQAKRENLRLRLTQDRLRGAFDQMTGPGPIMEGATAIGLVESAAYGPVILSDD